MNSVTMGPNSRDSRNQYKKRFGCIPARIGSEHMLRLKIDWTSARPGEMARPIRKGTNVQLTVQDITRHSKLAAEAKWVCMHPECRGKDWDSKEELLAAHPDNRILEKQEETHLYYATVQRVAVAAKPAKLEGNKEIAPATEAIDCVVMVLSDEE
jgi:hypothetical protein